MDRYRAYANRGVGGMSAAQARRLKEQEEIASEQDTRAALVRKSNALTALADHMAEQNEKMLAGLKALSSRHDGEVGSSTQVDFVQRNILDVSSSRPSLDRREQALIARAEVMAAATASLGAGGAPSVPVRFQPPMPSRPRVSGRAMLGGGSTRLRPETEEDLVAAALAEIEHGQSMTAFESKTRKAPPKSYR